MDLRYATATTVLHDRRSARELAATRHRVFRTRRSDHTPTAAPMPTVAPAAVATARAAAALAGPATIDVRDAEPCVGCAA